MSNPRHRIAWANDTTKLSNDAVREDQIRYVGSMAEVIYNSERVSIPAAWLRPVEPGHVWWRRNPSEEWKAGLINVHGELIDGDVFTKLDPNYIQILPAHTTPPDAEFDRDEAISREYTEEMDDRAASSQPTYARRWEDLSREEKQRLIDVWSRNGNESGYNLALRLASLPTLRNADEFTRDELQECTRAYVDAAMKGTIWDAKRAGAAKAIEIAKRSTS